MKKVFKWYALVDGVLVDPDDRRHAVGSNHRLIGYLSQDCKTEVEAVADLYAWNLNNKRPYQELVLLTCYQP